jgi:hypothetical protein
LWSAKVATICQPLRLAYGLQLQPLVFDGLVPVVGADSQIKGNALLFRGHNCLPVSTNILIHLI